LAGVLERPCVIVFCGIPGSGKSTIARKLATELEKSGRVRLVISDRISDKIYERIFKLLSENLGTVDYFLVDATFYRKEWREKVKTIAGEGNVLLCYLRCPLRTCIERNKSREPSLPERAIHIISKEMEGPENPDVLIDTGKVGSERAVAQILEKLIHEEWLVISSQLG
jgi:adenylylsulfate kinase-like enzyme